MTYDNTCKYLAEKYPAQFIRWLRSIDTAGIQVLKTELSPEPVRADSVTFLQIAGEIQHLEFQTLPQSAPPIDFRMLDYYTRLKRQYGCPIYQAVIFLQETSSELVFRDCYQDTNTRHQYGVIRMWEQDPAPLLADPALLPLATLARSDSPRALLEQVAERVASIEASDERRNLSACAGVLAGLRFDKDLIRPLFRNETMRESVIFQEILEEGRQEGIKQGVKQGEVALLVRLLNRRLGAVEPQSLDRIRDLSLPQLEELGEALLDFSQVSDLTAWLDRHQQ